MPKLIDAGVDAIFCPAADNTAIGLLSAAKGWIRISEDIANTAFDDLPIAQLSTSGLTTIKQPMKKIADEAYKMASTQRNEILK